jgi:pilus assembly protein CpaB
VALRYALIVFGVLAIGTGIFGLVGLYDQAQSRSETPVTVAVTPPTIDTQILVARRDIANGTLIGESDLAWAPAKWKPPLESFVRDGEGSFPALGAMARRDIRQGDVVSVDQIVQPSDGGFLAAVLAPGMRAMSVRISEHTGSAPLIAPGDRVDVLLTRDDARQVSEIVLRDRRVIATAAKPSPIVTLEVNPTEAQTLATATQGGAIHLTPRAATDPVARTEPAAQWSDEPEKEIASDRAEPSLPVILRGSKGDTREDAF